MPNIVLKLTDRVVGWTYLKNYKSYENYGPPGTFEDGSPGRCGYQPDKLDTNLYIAPTYQLNLV